VNLMKKAYISAAVVLCSASVAVTAADAQITDTIQAPTGYFVPTDAQKYDDGYWRYQNQDWGWQHNAIAGTITAASLNISAFDVDFDDGEIDNIYAYDNGVAVLLGALAGGSDIYSFTTFSLGSNFYDDIASGLQVWVDIDSNNSGWQLTLAKSSLTVNGGTLPPAGPGVPEPASWAMLIGGFGLAGSALRRKRKASALRLA
jgi:PEP-CTERM motif